MSASESVDPETPIAATPGLNDDVSSVDNSADGDEKQHSEVENGKAADLEKTRRKFQENAKNYLIEQASHIVIPSFAKWFNMNEIHSIEKKLFPDFFPSREGEEHKSVYKNPQTYRNMRDFMINSYRINPIEYLTVTAIRRNLAGDVSSIIRIHQFLEKWGLINYQIDPRTKSTVVGPQYTGHFQVTLDTPKGLVPFIPDNIKITGGSENPLSPPSSVEPELKNELDEDGEAPKPEIPINLEIRRNIYTSSGDVAKTLKTHNIIQYFCSICGKDTSEVRYHNLKSKSYSNNPSSTINTASILCHTCHEQGLFPLNFQSSDFIKLESTNDNIEWSEQEVLLLLEGIEMFGTFDMNSNNANNALNSNSNGQWDKVAEFVGTKTKDQCLSKFIQLPIEDRYLNKLINPAKKSEPSGKETLVQDIVEKIVSSSAALESTKQNALTKLDESIKEQSSLINQVIELTLEKFNLKLDNVECLEDNLMKTEQALKLERKQLLIERWSNFEKIKQFKNSNGPLDPKTESLLDDLLKPVEISEVSKLYTNKEDVPNSNNGMEIDASTQRPNGNDLEPLPVSVSHPKNYQFWSG